ncbi:MAG: AAA family ATPase [Clostridia bacterium]
MIITIGREYGSGGKYIGEQLAKRLQMSFYDKEIIKRLSKEKNIDEKILESMDEKHKNSFWYTLAMSALSFEDSVNSLTDLPTEDKYFIETSKMIEEIAQENNSIIIGRCANVILRNKPDSLHIFLYASDMDFKIKRKIEFAGMTNQKAKKMIERIDKQRASYYAYYTEEKWGAKESYDLLIDTSKIGVEETIHLIENLVK